MIVKPIDFNWNPNFSIFAKESFLKSVGDKYGWVGGYDSAGDLCFVLPYTIINKFIFRMVRFRVETISINNNFEISKEKDFLTQTIKYFKSIKANIIIPATTNTIFRTYPDGAIAAPYGSYIIDLDLDHNSLWKNLNRIVRQNINKAKKEGVLIKNGDDYLIEAYDLIKETFNRSDLPFMDIGSFRRYISGIGKNGLFLVADYQNVPQSVCFFAFSNYCAYAIYAGNKQNMIDGSNKLLYWEAILFFKSIGVRYFDFVGARINPAKGSKQDNINAIKRRFGATLKEGFIWKYPINSTVFHLYNIAANFRTGGDIVDAEHHKLQK
ncbi:MAG: hypothetical protein KQI78_06840 [Deltaproteobacteria bacterium]|nr:hypothetical protein [Deltaproteobacteria bacterium]